MGSAVATLIYLGLGAGMSVLATSVRKKRTQRRKYFIGNLVVGTAGAWLGSLFGPVGPSIYGISLIVSALTSAGAVAAYNKISDNVDNNTDTASQE